MKKNAERFVHAVFCDDIRQEMGGKVSLMGCFQGDLLVPFLPVALPKLCVFVTVSTPVKRPLKSLKIRIMQDDAELASLDVPEGATPVPIVEDGVTRFLANAAMVFSPFAISAPTAIRVLVVTEEGEIIGPRLRIKAMPEQAAVPPGTLTAARKVRKAPAKKPTARRAQSK
ncbi:MAG: hypothetical protein NDI67_09380 [Sulfuritalea sp.]|nr:hypothetical protein [Sulfuritalea sp.]